MIDRNNHTHYKDSQSGRFLGLPHHKPYFLLNCVFTGLDAGTGASFKAPGGKLPGETRKHQSKRYCDDENRCWRSPEEASIVLKGLEFRLISGLNICFATLSRCGNPDSFNNCLLNFYRAQVLCGRSEHALSELLMLRRQVLHKDRSEDVGSILCVEKGRRLRDDMREGQGQRHLRDLGRPP